MNSNLLNKIITKQCFLNGILSKAYFSTNNRNSRKEQFLSMKNKNLLTLKNYDPFQIEQLLWSAIDMKKVVKSNGLINNSLRNILGGKSIAAIFEKKSTRTRFSFEAGAHHLGAHTIFCNRNDIHLGESESVKDTAIVMSHLVNAITARVYEHSLLEEFCKYSKVPIINALSDSHHPMQALADLQTIYEHFGCLKGLKIAWVGDGNNVLSSLLIVASKMKMNIAASIPEGYIKCKESISYAEKLAILNSTKVSITTRPEEAIKDANIIVTDTWISMGQEKEKEKRLLDFKGYQITMKMIEENTNKDWIFLHCLPRKLEEVNDEVFYHKKSRVFQEAENRKWTTMAVLANLVNGYTPRVVKTVPKF